jgi:hypothetical protein
VLCLMRRIRLRGWSSRRMAFGRRLSGFLLRSASYMPGPQPPLGAPVRESPRSGGLRMTADLTVRNQRTVSRWRRVGPPVEFSPGVDDDDVAVGWTWRIGRYGFKLRNVRIVVSKTRAVSALAPTEESRLALVSRGASALDRFLGDDEPPAVIVVLASGVFPRPDHGE